VDPYPFSALVGQGDLALALLLNAVSPAIGGVLVRGEKGTAKSTAVRGLARLLPEIQVVDGCPFNCDPSVPALDCPAGPHPADATRRRRPVPLVELPVGASTDRVAGSLDLEHALTEGRRAFEPGLLAAAHRGLLYVDEVNLLGDHLVDLLLDAAALGVNYVEREGVSVRHPARFLLVGTMNPEEGELRPQLLDRFGITVEVRGNADPAERVEVIRRRLAYEADPNGFASAWAAPDAALTGRIVEARRRLPGVRLPDELLERVAAVCAAFAVDGLRGDIVTAKTAVALAAWAGRGVVELADVRRAALLALPHRRRRGPMDAPGLDEEELDRILGSDPEPPPGGGPPPDGGSPDGGTGPPRDADQAGGPPHGPPHGAPHGDGRVPEPTGAGVGTGSPAGPGRSGAPAASGDPNGPSGLTARDGGAPRRAGERTGAAAAVGREEVTGPGRVFAPILLELAGLGAGALGRRSRAETASGQAVSDRSDRSPYRTAVAVAATLRAAAPHQRARQGSGGLGVQQRDPGAGRSAATNAARAGGARPAVVVHPGDLRWQVREGREGNLVLFVVDASGSMAARRRMVATKGAVLSLLLDAYQRRDRVGLVSFRGAGAEVRLPPTSSVELAARRLAELPTGGRTPLAAGLARARGLLAAEAVRDPNRRPLLVLVTDGRANAVGGGAALPAGRLAAGRADRPPAGPGGRPPAGPGGGLLAGPGGGLLAGPGGGLLAGPGGRLPGAAAGRGPATDGLDPVVAALAEARALAARGVGAVVVDTEDGVVRLGLAAELARALAAPCLRLEALEAQPLAGVVRALTGAPGAIGGSRTTAGADPASGRARPGRHTREVA
jgi:magnesium chelatase subunit D